MAIDATLQKKANKERWAWYLYDFGNSAYAGVVLLAVYSAYFKGEVVGGARGSWLWGLSVGIAMLTVAVISPMLGTIADFSGSKKKFLFGFTSLNIVFTALLFFVGKGDVFIGMLFFIVAEIGYRSGQVFYNSLLPEIASKEDMDKVSGTGWAIGSAGGVICLLIVLAMIMLIGGDLIIRFSLVFTALFYALSTIPMWMWLKEKKEGESLPAGENYFQIGYKRLRHTIKSVRKYKEFLKFIIAFLVYNDGILMMLNFAAIIGAVLFGMEQTQLIIMMVIVQVTSAIGAYVFGIIADRWYAKRALVLSLILMLGCVVTLIFVQTIVQFYILAGVAGFALTGVQSVSRSVVGQLAPEGQSGEFYGLFAVAGRTSSFIGPTVYGYIAAWAAAWYMDMGQPALLAEQNGQRMAVLSIGVFLIVGLVLLFRVRIPMYNKNGDA